jgi:Spy/CpxP family protein refolding chaperone
MLIIEKDVIEARLESPAILQFLKRSSSEISMTLRFFIPVLCFVLTTIPTNPLAQHHRHQGAPTPYAGFESRTIKSLSSADIQELRLGGGWGLALPAELNGVPGPAHLLELKNELGLSARQVARISAIYEKMKSEAIAAGKRFIAAERAINKAFARGGLDENQLRSLIDRSEAARAQLRLIHLSRHLLTPRLLTAEQIEQYKVLRGYVADPCARIPEGHNAEMWRRHNKCN